MSSARVVQCQFQSTQLTNVKLQQSFTTVTQFEIDNNSVCDLLTDCQVSYGKNFSRYISEEIFLQVVSSIH